MWIVSSSGGACEIHPDRADSSAVAILGEQAPFNYQMKYVEVGKQSTK
jgi:hypothetical protein